MDYNKITLLNKMALDVLQFKLKDSTIGNEKLSKASREHNRLVKMAIKAKLLENKNKEAKEQVFLFFDFVKFCVSMRQISYSKAHKNIRHKNKKNFRLEDIGLEDIKYLFFKYCYVKKISQKFLSYSNLLEITEIVQNELANNKDED